MNARPELRPVLVGTDGSTAADAAAHAAAVAAAALGTHLQVLRAFDWPTPGVAGLAADVDGRAIARQAARDQVRRLVARLGEWLLPATSVDGEVVDGPAGHVLREASAGAVLLVVGAHGQTWSGGVALGSVAAGAVRRSLCPVLVHRPTDALAGQRAGVVVGIDGGPGSAEVLAAAAREAQVRRTALHVVHTWPQLTEDAGTSVRWRLDPGAVTTAEQAVVSELVRALRRTTGDLEVHTAVVAGRAGPSLVQAGRVAELVVVGRPALPDDQETRATTRQVANRSDCPVLVVPLPAPATAPVRVPG